MSFYVSRLRFQLCCKTLHRNVHTTPSPLQTPTFTDISIVTSWTSSQDLGCVKSHKSVIFSIYQKDRNHTSTYEHVDAVLLQDGSMKRYRFHTGTSTTATATCLAPTYKISAVTCRKTCISKYKETFFWRSPPFYRLNFWVMSHFTIAIIMYLLSIT